MKKHFLLFLAACLTAASAAFADKYKFNRENLVVDLNPSEWRAVDMSDWTVKEGSALDVSADYPSERAGVKGRLATNRAARFVFENEPDREVRFKGTNWRPGNYFSKGLATKADIDKVAKSIRARGYNLVRWRLSMNKGKEFDAPYQMNPRVRDLYDYFIFALAREGIYTHFHLASHDLGDPSFVWKDRYDVKLKMIFGDKKTWEDWRKLVKMQLEHVNPYTGKAWKDDASIITTEYFNELELGIVMRKNILPEAAEYGDEAFCQWLKTKFASIDELNAKWGKKFKSFEDIKAFSGAYGSLNTPEFSRFFVEKSIAMQNYCEKVLRKEIGCKTLLHHYNCGVRPDIWMLGAMAGNYMALNVYSRNKNGTIAEGCRYWRCTAAKKVSDMPMVVTEYQHMPETENVHETGVIFPAYSALQDYSILTVHDCAVFPDPKDPYNTTSNPIFRANEFLSHCMFMRGDVKKSPNRVDVVYSKDFVKKDGGMWRTPLLEQTKVAFLTGYATQWPSIPKKGKHMGARIAKPAFKMQPESGKYLGSTSGPEFNLSQFVSKLREAKILPQDNITDVEKGVYQSDTGEITMRQKEGLAKVVTEKTEAVALKPDTKNEKLGALTVKSTSVPASVAVCSMDGKPISQSGKIVLVYATSALVNARNITKGESVPVPAIVRVGKLSAALKLDDPSKYSVYALKIGGERIGKIASRSENGELLLEIDTSKLPKEPSIFYEISR